MTVWEEIYLREGIFSLDPHPEMSRVADFFHSRGDVKRVLDLGSGSGRHTVYLAARGFDVYALDSSPTGLAHTLKVLSERGLSAHLTFHDMNNLPYDDHYFDAVISIQVIHHNSLRQIRATIKEIARVLRDAGLLWVTVPVSKNEPSTAQEEIEPGTFVPLDGREKGLPHHYFTMDALSAEFRGFRTVDLHVDPANHFSLLAEKRRCEG